MGMPLRNDEIYLLREEELFEDGIVGGNGQGEFRLAEMEGQAFGEWRSLADGFLDHVSEFGGVGSGEDQALRRFRMSFAEGAPGVYANGGMGIGDVAAALPDRVHFLESFSVGCAVAPDFLANVFDAVAAEIEETREIVGIADVHGVGVGGDGGTRMVFAGEKILGDNVVGVGGGDEAGNGNADAFGENASSEIAEIPAGNGDNERN